MAETDFAAIPEETKRRWQREIAEFIGWCIICFWAGMVAGILLVRVL